MKLSIYKTVTQSMGFAFHEYETTARMAWFPLVLVYFFSIFMIYFYLSLATGSLVGFWNMPYLDALKEWQSVSGGFVGDNPALVRTFELGRQLLILVLSTSFMVPLYRLATRGIKPAKGAFNIPFGFSYIKLVLAFLFVGACVFVAVNFPTQIAIGLLDEHVARIQSTPWVAFPDENSLHTYDFVDKDVSVWKGIGTAVLWIGSALFIYINIRLVALPAFVMARGETDNYNSFYRSLEVSRGFNALKLIVIMLILGGIIFFTGWVLQTFVIGFIEATINAIYNLFGVVDVAGAREGATASDSLSSFWFLNLTLISLANMLYLFFVYGLFAGLGGSLYRAYEEQH